MTRLFPSKRKTNMLDETLRDATMMLMCASASLRNFSGEKPFVNPMTGETCTRLCPRTSTRKSRGYMPSFAKY